MPRPPSFDERDVSDKPKFVRRRPPLSREDLTQIERDYRCGLAALLALDDAVGRIVSRLEATGQLANTVLIFLTDQGVMAGEHRIKRGKNRPYEEAIRVPLLMRGPSIAAGAQVEAPVANADLAPTMLEIAGAPIPPELARPIDGVSLASVLSGAPDDRRRAVPIEGRDNVSGSRRGFKVRSYVGVRTARYAYFEYRRARFDTRAAGIDAEIGAGRTTERELYDLAARPLRAAQPRPRPGVRERPPEAGGRARRARALLGRRVRAGRLDPRAVAPGALAWTVEAWRRDGSESRSGERRRRPRPSPR